MRWLLGVCSIRVWAKNHGDPYYEPTIAVHDMCLSFHTYVSKHQVVKAACIQNKWINKACITLTAVRTSKLVGFFSQLKSGHAELSQTFSLAFLVEFSGVL